MAMDLTSYKDFAENDYQYFRKDYENGRVANYMAAIAQNICERYIKHIIDRYDEPQNEIQAARKTEALHTHGLTRLMDYLEDMGYPLESDIRLRIKGADGYYFTARYPGNDSIEVTRTDIDECAVAVSTCRERMFGLEEQIINERGGQSGQCHGRVDSQGGTDDEDFNGR